LFLADLEDFLAGRYGEWFFGFLGLVDFSGRRIFVWLSF
jgi:hypothetical protein